MLGQAIDERVTTSAAGDPRLGRYQLRGLASEGGVGRIFAALRRWDQRKVAIKLLHDHLGDDARCRAQLRREAEALIVASSPGVVTLLEQGTTTSGRPFLVLEWIEGVSLRTMMSIEGPPPAWRLRRLFLSLLDTLRVVHARGVVHCDLKPENVMVEASLLPHQERARVIDFGVASIRQRHFAGAGQVFGTPGYVAPEVMRGAAPSTRSDLYAVGVILFLMLTGRKPFDTNEIPELIRLQTTGPAPRVSAFNAAVTPALDDVLARALARDPDQRFPDAAAFRRALADALEDDDTMPEPSTWQPPATLASGTPPGGAQTISVISGQIVYT